MLESPKRGPASNNIEEERTDVQDDDAADFHVPRIPDHNSTIVTITSDTCHVYLQLNHISTWEVAWPPLQGPAIHQPLCEELHLDLAVISLIKRLLYIRYSGVAADIEFIRFYSQAFVYLEHYEIRGGRDPDGLSYEEPRLDLHYNTLSAFIHHISSRLFHAKAF